MRVEMLHKPTRGERRELKRQRKHRLKRQKRFFEKED